jgi:UDP-4-amino-4-deoxy-L-arabinose-oxoglutarate aminotransferase
MEIPFFKHNLSAKDIRLAAKVMKSHFITTGPVTAEFESLLAAKTGNRFALGMTSCTAGLHAALVALGIGPGDEVLVPAITFVSSVNVIEHAGARPVLVDVDPETGLMDLEDAERRITAKTKAMIPVHLYGQMADMRGMKRLADFRGLKIIEDSAHAVDAERDGAKIGNLSDVAAFSFYATKNITSGEGGAVVTNDEKLFQRMKTLRLHGMSVDAIGRYNRKTFHQYDVEFPGFKYNMTDIQAALLMNQLRNIEANTAKRERIAKRWEAFLGDLGCFDFPRHRFGKSSRHLFCVWVRQRERRDEVISFLNSKGIPVSVHFHPVHLFTYYRKKYGYKMGDFPVAERIGFSTITLPFYPQIRLAHQRYLMKVLAEAEEMLSRTS